MRRLPGGVWYEPADLGFDNTLIPANDGVDGLVIPWNAAAAFRRLVVHYVRDAGPSADFSVNFTAIDLDGTTELDSINFWTVITPPDTSYWIADDNVARAGSGTASTGRMGLMLGGPYGLFRVVNNDAALAGNVSLRVLLGTQV